jgi:hypothetical protein
MQKNHSILPICCVPYLCKQTHVFVNFERLPSSKSGQMKAPLHLALFLSPSDISSGLGVLIHFAGSVQAATLSAADVP